MSERKWKNIKKDKEGNLAMGITYLRKVNRLDGRVGGVPSLLSMEGPIPSDEGLLTHEEADALI